jgi:DNA-binding NarL/FixJ family response regulator
MDTARVTGDCIRVLIVDDHALVRQGLRTFLELSNQVPDSRAHVLPIQIVGEATNGREAVELACAAQPDVILLDLVMPELNGLEAIPRIRKGSPGSRILVLTSFTEGDKILPAIQAGAHGYLLKDIAPQALAQAIRGAFAGDVQLHPTAAKKLMEAAAQGNTKPEHQKRVEGALELTERELEVVELIASGMNNRTIAERLFVSEKTVKTHVGNILQKLNLEDRTQVAIYAIRHGLAKDQG